VTETVRTRWYRRDPRELTVLLHYASLAAAFALLLWLDHKHWFIGDEWSTLVDRKLGGGAGVSGIWEPHNEHWSTIPVVVYRALFTVFGVRTYIPYVVVLLLVHLAIVHLLWRLMLRLGVDALLATVLCGAFAVLGAGGDNLSLAWQMQLVAPIATGLGALLLAPEHGGLGRRDLWVSLLLLAGLMCSGVGLTMMAVVGLVALLRRGWKVALGTVALPAVAYAVWYLAYGRDAGSQNPDSLSTAVQKVPEYVWRGLTDAVDGTFGLSGIGPAVLAALAVWLVLRARADDSRWDVPLAMAAGAVLFLALTDLRRSGLGIDTAGTSRYVYVVVALLLPAGALALDALLARSALRLPAVVALAALLLAVQLPELNRVADHWTVIDRSVKSRVLGSAALAREGQGFLSVLPVPEYMPGLTVDKIRKLSEDGKLPGGRVTERERLDAALYTQVASYPGSARRKPEAAPALALAGDATVEPGSSAACRKVVPEGQNPGVLVQVDEPGSVIVRTGKTEPLRLSLWRGDVASQARRIDAVAGVPVRIRAAVHGLALGVGVPVSGVTEICGLATSSPRHLDPVRRS